MLFSKWAGMIRFIGHCDTWSAHANTFTGSLSNINFRNIGATNKPPCNALKFFSSEVAHDQGYKPANGRLPSPNILDCVRTVYQNQSRVRLV